MKKRYIALVALGVVLVLVGTFFIQASTIYSSQVVAKEKGSPVGIAPFTDRIDFGDIPQGATVGRTLIFENMGAVPNQVIIFVIGGIADLVKVEPSSSFTLEPGEYTEIDFVLTMPPTVTPEKKYSGRIIVLRLPRAIW